MLNETSNQHENTTYAIPNSNAAPQPYEQAQSMPRYSGGPAVDKIQASRKEGKFTNLPPKFVQPQSVSSHDKSRESKTESYYARPRFFRPGRISSTSTHIYGEIDPKNVEFESDNTESSSMYVSPHQLEPFVPSAKGHQVTEKELMLGNIEEDDSICSGSEEGSLSDEFDEYPGDEEEEEVGQEEAWQEEEVEEETGGSVDYSLDEPSSWVNKSPATGQVNPLAALEPEYINTQRGAPLEESEEPDHGTDEVRYINARAAAAAAIASTKPHSIKSAPSRARKKKKVKRNKSTPSFARQQDQGEKEEQYIGLTLETANYTSVYTSTHRHNPSDRAGYKGTQQET